MSAVSRRSFLSGVLPALAIPVITNVKTCHAALRDNAVVSLPLSEKQPQNGHTLTYVGNDAAWEPRYPTGGGGTAQFCVWDQPGVYGDGANDDAPGFQAALDAMAAAGGGRLLVPARKPDGTPATYVWRTPLSLAPISNGVGSRGIWEIAGEGAPIVIDGAGLVALTVQNANIFRMSAIRFYGSIDAANPNSAPAPIANVLYAVASYVELDGVELYGLIVADDGRGTGQGTRAHLYATGSSLIVRNMQAGSLGTTGGSPAIIKCDQWVNFTMEDSTFADFYVVGNTAMAFGGQQFSQVWLGQPMATFAGVESVFGQSKALLRNCRFDELQGYFVIEANGGDGFINHLEIDGCKSNLSPTSNSRFLSLYRVKSVWMHDCHVREGSTGSCVVAGSLVDTVRIERHITPNAADGVRGLGLDASVHTVTIVDCVNGTTPTIDPSGSHAEQTIVEVQGRRNLPAYATANRPAAATVPAGTAIYNTTTSLPNYSDATTWRDGLGNLV